MASNKTIRTRFAPSPTGYLHIGNARTALFNYLFAKKYSGKSILRIEDTDRVRSTKEFEDSIMEDLRWLGLDWDEGPDKGGAFGPYRQSERFSLYTEFAEKLLAEDKAYPCYCSHERLEELRKKQEKAGWPPKYDGKCRTLPKSDRPTDREPVIRIKIPEKVVSFEDAIHKKCSFDSTGFGDFIIIGSDSIATYNFAVVIDDALMGITHAIRGDDHLSNTPRQILLFETLAFPVPKYAHMPLILGPDRAPLSKRHGIASIRDLKEKGYLPETVINHLCHLGLSPGKDFLSMSEAIQAFSLEKVSRSPALFDIERLTWFNRAYIEKADIARLVPLVKQYFNHNIPQERLEQMVKAAQGEATTLRNIPEITASLFKEPVLDEDAKKALSEPSAQMVLKALAEEIEYIMDINAYTEIMTATKKQSGEAGKRLFMPIRAALTGRLQGIELEKVFALLGKHEILKRIKRHLL